MKHVKKSVLLWYSAPEMYQLVTAVADYPKFLPWCEKAEVLDSSSTAMTAKLHLAYMGVRHAFTTRNVQVPDASVVVGLVDGPFSVLDGTWAFVPLGAEGKACLITIRMLKRGLSPAEEIAEIVGMPLSFVLKIQKELEKNPDLKEK